MSLAILLWVMMARLFLGHKRCSFVLLGHSIIRNVFFGHYNSESSEEGIFIAYNFKDKGLKIIFTLRFNW